MVHISPFAADPLAQLLQRVARDEGALLSVPRGGGSEKKPMPMRRPRWYTAVPEPARFFISGNVGNVLLFFLERVLAQAIHPILPESLVPFQDSISFFLAYFLDIAVQHYLHAVLVYGLESIDTLAKYVRTLRGMYAALVTAAIGSTILNAVFLKLGILKELAFVVTMGSFSVINYFWIGRMVKKSELAAKQESLTASRGGAVDSDDVSLRSIPVKGYKTV